MVFHIITIFPESFDSYLKESIIGRAILNKKITVKFYNPREYVAAGRGKDGNYKPVDDKPYGGGPGMVMQAEPILKAVEKAISKTKRQKAKTKIIIFSPSGKNLNTEYVKNVSKKYTDIIMISGRYEGIDARVKKILKAEDVSIGDYVLTGGELPAMIMIDTISRQIPGVLGKIESLEESRVSSSEMYTKPEILKFKGKNYRVPKVLLSGHHAKIEEWKRGRKS